MGPALNFLNKALYGDVGAREFLESTTTSYVLDVSNPSKPKTYGCWNFIHLAISEVERYEANVSRQVPTGVAHANANSLVSHTRLLATMALRVARRPPAADQVLISNCIRDAENFYATEQDVQWLKDFNLELREIVMGRIAAMAFDFSFYRQSGTTVTSAFADRVVIDTLCAILSANAVSSGPTAIRNFSTEWIIPSSKSIPSFALVSVVRHLAMEGIRISAPAGTKDMLQQLSALVFSVAIGPRLAEAVSGNTASSSTEMLSHFDSSLIAATCLNAMKAWCESTDLSLPQVKHICLKAEVNIVEVLNDAMYSDSHEAIDALAELIESTVHVSDDVDVSIGRMKQLQHILQLDESTFHSKFDAVKLALIETREMSDIVEELVSAVGLQRFRFTEREKLGGHDVCRNLVRIGASVCETWLNLPSQEMHKRVDDGLVHLLLKGAAHPSVNICAIALQALSQLVPATPNLDRELLPILQRRAITPHNISPHGSVSLAETDACGVNYQEFKAFRETTLSDSLLACWRGNSTTYMNSCTSAIEEFCLPTATPDICLHLEAAIFCLEAVALESLQGKELKQYSPQMKRCSESLSSKPRSLIGNPLTLARLCSFVRQYSSWFKDEDGLGIAADLLLSAFSLSATNYIRDGKKCEIERETCESPLTEASLALERILCLAPSRFTDPAILSSLSHAWIVSYSVIRRGNTIALKERVALCTGICFAAASASKRASSGEILVGLVDPGLEYINQLAAEFAQGNRLQDISSQMADEIRLLASLFRTFATAGSIQATTMESGCNTSSNRRTQLEEPVISMVQKSWPTVTKIATSFSHDKSIASSLAFFLAELLPAVYTEARDASILREIFSLAFTILRAPGDSTNQALAIFAFLEELTDTYGLFLENAPHTRTLDPDFDLAKQTAELLQRAFTCTRLNLGSAWIRSKEQDEGQRAYESKSPPRGSSESLSNSALCSALSLLKKMMEFCPTFLLSLSSPVGHDQNSDMLFYRAFNSAVESINDSDPKLGVEAIGFILSVTRLGMSQDQHVRSYATESILGKRSEIVHSLLVGSCGNFDYNSIQSATNLLYFVVGVGEWSETEASVVESLRQAYFALGDECKTLTLRVLERCRQKILTPADLGAFLEEVWRIHQASGEESLATTDVVERFTYRFQ